MKPKLFENISGNQFKMIETISEGNYADDFKVIEMMRQYGGSFVKALGLAARYADPDNLERIKKAWPEYWQKYSDLASKQSQSK